MFIENNMKKGIYKYQSGSSVLFLYIGQFGDHHKLMVVRESKLYKLNTLCIIIDMSEMVHVSEDYEITPKQ